jgi:alpha-amylase
MKILVPILILLISTLSMASPRTVFVQLFEWPWSDVARECEIYLGPAGFSAVQVSPPNEHISLPDHPWWERYQPVSYKLESRGGTTAGFASMVRRCRAAGVDVYTDAVFNHMSAQNGSVGFAGTPFQHYEYPGLYSFNDFHHCGRNGNDEIKNFDDIYELQNCELLGLADLDTGSDKVQNTIAQYLNSLIDLGVAGFRIDAAKHMAPRDLQRILSKLKRPVYIYQEMIVGQNDRLDRRSYLPLGDITLYSYPFRLGNALKNNSLSSLQSGMGEDINSTDAIVFIENHDLQRWSSSDNLVHFHEQPELYRLAQIFMLTWPYGYPHLFSGYDYSNYDQGPPMDSTFRTTPVLNSSGQCRAPWTCEHRLPEIGPLVQFRNNTDRAFYVSDWWSDGHNQIAFGRGPLGFVVINASNTVLRGPFKTQLKPGSYCNILTNCNSKHKVSSAGQLYVDVAPFSAAVFSAEVTK